LPLGAGLRLPLGAGLRLPLGEAFLLEGEGTLACCCCFFLGVVHLAEEGEVVLPALVLGMMDFG
jgi:hypothetical protein